MPTRFFYPRPEYPRPDRQRGTLEGYDWLNRSFYSFGSMYRRIWKLHRSVQVFGPMNLGFRSAIRRKTTA